VEEKKKRNERYDSECMKITQCKNIAYKEMVQKRYTRGAVEKYKELRRDEDP
jgi:hypothetical protein